MPYQNTDECWKALLDASKDARYLGLISANDFVDRRNDKAIMNIQETSAPGIYVVGSNLDLGEMGKMPEPPSAWLSPGVCAQRYQVEIWAEKTTMNDVLEPIAEQYGVTLVTGSGEISTTHCNLCVERAKQDGRPVRILYISDFDPGGRSMPVAAARKIEFFARNSGIDLDIQLRPVVLTPEQCERFGLPRTPIKEGEKRATRFESRFGEGATELDALEALHPGVLAEIIEHEIARYHDDDLDANTKAAARPIQAELNQVTAKTHKAHANKIDDLRKEYAALITARDKWAKRASPVWQAISREIATKARPLINGINWPEPKEGDEDADPLFDSTRGYVEQIDRFKHHQGKPTTRVKQGEGPKSKKNRAMDAGNDGGRS